MRTLRLWFTAALIVAPLTFTAGHALGATFGDVVAPAPVVGGTVDGQQIFTYNPTDTTTAQASVRINVTTAAANEKLQSWSNASVSVANIDAEGDLTLSGTCNVTGATTLSSTLDARGSISNGGAVNSGAVYVNDSLSVVSGILDFEGLDVRGNSGIYNGGASSDLLLADIIRLNVSATYVAADCDAVGEVGRVVMHNSGANKITLCICEQTAAATYAFGAATAAGVCP